MKQEQTIPGETVQEAAERIYPSGSQFHNAVEQSAFTAGAMWQASRKLPSSPIPQSNEGGEEELRETKEQIFHRVYPAKHHNHSYERYIFKAMQQYADQEVKSKMAETVFNSKAWNKNVKEAYPGEDYSDPTIDDAVYRAQVKRIAELESQLSDKGKEWTDEDMIDFARKFQIDGFYMSKNADYNTLNFWKKYR